MNGHDEARTDAVEPRTGPPTAAPVKKGQSLELEVENLAFGGKALAKIDGFVVFVENVLPGDRVQATVFKKRRSYAEARAERILRPSPARIAPRCEHVPTCGGCRFQDLDYAEQLRHKERQIEECLEHLGRLRVAPSPIVPAPKLFHYRNKMEYSFARDSGGRLTLGLHVRGFFDRTFDLARCHIATPISSEIVAFVREAARRASLAAYDTRSHHGLL